jgi:hypothetical protein
VKFTDIDENVGVYPGEYILHSPSNAIVLVGAYNRESDFIRVFKDGKLFEDKVNSFKKIQMAQKEARVFKKRNCGSCKGGN